MLVSSLLIDMKEDKNILTQSKITVSMPLDKNSCVARK